MKVCTLDEMLVRHSAPTMAGIKTANLFSMNTSWNEPLREQTAHYNRQVLEKHIRLIPLGAFGHRTLLYLYRPFALEQDLDCPSCRSFLEKLGYPVDSVPACLRECRYRLECSGSFPHEIGFFLGYPPEDVIAFIESGPDKARCRGCWCAYSHLEQAQSTFQAYRQCSRIYYAHWKKGASVEELTLTIERRKNA